VVGPTGSSSVAVITSISDHQIQAPTATPSVTPYTPGANAAGKNGVAAWAAAGVVAVAAAALML